MTKKQINIGLASILTTAAEVGDDMPLGPAYMALMGNGYSLSDFQILTTILAEAKLAVVAQTTLSLTVAGLDMAAKCEAAAKSVTV